MRLAHAIEAIAVEPNQEKIDITAKGELYEGRGDRLADRDRAGPDGYVGRMAVPASTPGTNPGWLVFALTNPTDKRIERWLVAPRYTLANSRVVWPELDAGRIAAVTPSLGFVPERMKSDRADMFRLSARARADHHLRRRAAPREHVPRAHLWDPNAYQAKQQDRMLFNGVLLGITGLLAIFLTAIFAANHKAIFPATALVAWAVLAYFCVDFGFWHKLFPVGPGPHRALPRRRRSGMAASLVLFLYTFLRIGLWHGWIGRVFWCLDRGAVRPHLRRHRRSAPRRRPCAAPPASPSPASARPDRLSRAARPGPRAVADPELDAAARLAVRRRHDRARQAVRRHRGVGLAAGLVLILVLLGFTVTQFAFRSRRLAAKLGPPSQRANEVARRRRLRRRVSGNGTRGRDQITVANEVEQELGPRARRARRHGRRLPPAHARRRPRALPADAVVAAGESRAASCRPISACGTRTAPTSGTSSRPRGAERRMRGCLRCVGLIRDVTDLKRAQERLMHDAVHDSLTGLPNRELFLDRLQGAITRATRGPANRPTVLFIDIDNFKYVNKSFGLVVGDSMLLTLARRLGRHLESAGHAGAARRRPIRHPADLRDRPAAGGHAGRAGAPRAAHADEDRRPRRSCSPPRSASSSMTARRRRKTCCAKARSPCCAPSAAAPTASRSSTPRMRGEEDEQAPARERSAQGAREAAARGALPADHPARLRTSWPASRRCCAGSIRRRGRLGPDEFMPDRRGVGTDRRARQLCARPGAGRGEPLAQGAAARPRPALRQRQCLEPPAVPPGHGAGDQADPGARGGAARAR